MKRFRIQYATGEYKIVEANNALEVVKKFDLANRDNIKTRLLDITNFTDEDYL